MGDGELRREHDFILNYLKIVDWKGNEYDFTAHYIEFTYEESIFTVPHGTLVAMDAIDYPTLLPIIGEERMKASFTRPDEKKLGDNLPDLKFDLHVYALTGKHQDQGSRKRQVYNLKYISDAPIKSVNTRVFKAYKGKLYSDMVQEIYDEFITDGKPLEIEKTLHEMDYVVNNEKPFNAIKKMCQRSISDEQNGSMYTFYEDRDKFYFMSLGKMFDRPVTTTISYEPKNINKDTPALEHKTKDLERDMYNVSQMSNGDGFDILHSAMSGEGSSNLLSINPIRRKFIEKTFDLREEYDSFKHIEKNKKWSDKNKMFGDKKSNPLMIVSNIGNDTAPYISDHEPGIKPYFFEEYKLHRLSQKMQISKHLSLIHI